MKIKKILIVLSVLTMISAVGCLDVSTDESSTADISVSEVEKKEESSHEKESEAEKKEESSQEEKTEAPTEAKEFDFSIKSVSLGKDYNDSDVLIVEYDYTNNSDKATSFTFACQDSVFQNGVECDSTVIGCDDVDTQQQLNDIQPGTTYTLKVGYHLSDLSSPANIVITDLFGQNELLNETIELN